MQIAPLSPYKGRTMKSNLTTTVFFLIAGLIGGCGSQAVDRVEASEIPSSGTSEMSDAVLPNAGEPKETTKEMPKDTFKETDETDAVTPAPAPAIPGIVIKPDVFAPQDSPTDSKETPHIVVRPDILVSPDKPALETRLALLEQTVVELSCDAKFNTVNLAKAVCDARCETVFVDAKLQKFREHVAAKFGGPAIPTSPSTPAELQDECRTRCIDQHAQGLAGVPEVCRVPASGN